MTPPAIPLLFLVQVLGSSILVESLAALNPSSIIEPSHIGDLNNTQIHPWLATLLNVDSRICSGSILSHNIILTSASCGFQISADSFHVSVGNSTTQTESSHKIVELRAILKNDQKFDRFVNDDIALIRVSPSFKFNKNVREILLPVNGNAVDENTVVDLPSWVMATESGNGRHKDHVDITTLRIENNVKCSPNQGYRGSNAYGQLCAVLKRGRVCQEDSGGPLVSNGVVLGIVPWTSGCKSTNDPKIYVNVASYLGWIDKNMKEMQTISNIFNIWDAYIAPMFWPVTA